MKFSLILCIFLFSVAAYGFKHHRHFLKDEQVGVSSKRLNEFVGKAIEGFRKVILNGDEEFDVPILEPNEIQDLVWEWEDHFKKNKLSLYATNDTLLSGLSTYTTHDVSASAKDLDAVISLHYDFLHLFGQYSLDGYLASNILPIFGDGSANIRAKNINAVITLNMSLVETFINVDQVHVDFSISTFEASAENLLKSPKQLTDKILNDQLQYLYQTERETFNKFVDQLVYEIAEEAFGGMTLDEFFDYLEYLGSKAD